MYGKGDADVIGAIVLRNKLDRITRTSLNLVQDGDSAEYANKLSKDATKKTLFNTSINEDGELQAPVLNAGFKMFDSEADDSWPC